LPKNGLMVPYINYRDLSPERSGEIVRNLQQLREDINYNGNAIKEELRQPKGNLNSPYAPDRSGAQNIKGSDQETHWRRRLDIIY